MTQPTHDEKVALVEKAKRIAVEEIDWYQDQKDSDLGLRQLNSWLAHKAFFERHEAIHGCDEHEQCDLFICRTCETAYPCPESVTTADLLVNGVPE